jgi:hypothetical protein
LLRLCLHPSCCCHVLHTFLRSRLCTASSTLFTPLLQPNDNISVRLHFTELFRVGTLYQCQTIIERPGWRIPQPHFVISFCISLGKWSFVRKGMDYNVDICWIVRLRQFVHTVVFLLLFTILWLSTSFMSAAHLWHPYIWSWRPSAKRTRELLKLNNPVTVSDRTAHGTLSHERSLEINELAMHVLCDCETIDYSSFHNLGY